MQTPRALPESFLKLCALLIRYPAIVAAFLDVLATIAGVAHETGEPV